MEKTRPIFIYLAVVALIFGAIGILIIIKNPSSSVIQPIQQNELTNSYSKEEVANHNSAEDCWIYSGNKVYDITLFLQIYEDETLRRGCGGGVNLNIFDENIQKILQEYEIGNLE